MFTIYSLTMAVQCGILYIELRERNKKKNLNELKGIAFDDYEMEIGE